MIYWVVRGDSSVYSDVVQDILEYDSGDFSQVKGIRVVAIGGDGVGDCGGGRHVEVGILLVRGGGC